MPLFLQDNTRYAFLQMDDRALIYRGADQPDMSVINPESDVWQHIKACYSQFPMHPSFTITIIDTPKLLGNQLANSIFISQQRWEADRHRRSKGVDTL